MGDFNTYWQMTINNPDDRDYALVRQGYPDDIRKLIWTPEVGKDGTPHIQAYIQMKRSVRFAHMKKLFPGAHLESQTSKEWRLNQHNYAQKDDKTTAGAHVIQNNDPLHTIEGTLRIVVERMINDYPDTLGIEDSRSQVQREMVIEDYTLAKVFVSSTYKTMWKDYGHEIYECLFQARVKKAEEELNTHTHTHAEKIISHEGGITDGKDSESGDDASESGSEAEDCEGDEDGETSEVEGFDEGGSVSGSSQDDSEGSGEQSDWE